MVEGGNLATNPVIDRQTAAQAAVFISGDSERASYLPYRRGGMQWINHLRAAAQIQPRSTIRGYVTAIRRTIPYAADFLPTHADDGRPQGRLRLPRLPESPRRFRADHHATARRGL